MPKEQQERGRVAENVSSEGKQPSGSLTTACWQVDLNDIQDEPWLERCCWAPQLGKPEWFRPPISENLATGSCLCGSAPAQPRTRTRNGGLRLTEKSLEAIDLGRDPHLTQLENLPWTRPRHNHYHSPTTKHRNVKLPLLSDNNRRYGSGGLWQACGSPSQISGPHDIS